MCHQSADVVLRLGHIGRARLEGRRRVACWVWEYPDVPPSWVRHARLFDDIRAPTTFAAEILAGALGRPVGLLPHPVGIASFPSADRSRSSVPSIPTLGFIGDTVAAYARKNVAGLVDCARLLAKTHGPCRLQMVLRGGRLPTGLVSALSAAEQDGVVIALTTDELSVRDLHDWWATIDIYVSLHHAEGFGLTVAEAMARGVPVVVTDEGATADFCNETTAWPVRSKPGVSDRNFDLAGPSIWRLPDHGDAVRQIGLVLSNPEAARTKAREGQRLLTTSFGSAAFLDALRTPRWFERSRR